MSAQPCGTGLQPKKCVKSSYMPPSIAGYPQRTRRFTSPKKYCGIAIRFSDTWSEPKIKIISLKLPPKDLLHRRDKPNTSSMGVSFRCRTQSEVSAMRTWQTDTGHLACRWLDLGKRVRYTARWMQENPDVRGSYLPAVPNFANHSPFGGPSWFQLQMDIQDSE